MSDAPINLNQWRKKALVAKKRAKADENAVKFGRSKPEKQAAQAKESLRINRLDAHKRDTDTD